MPHIRQAGSEDLDRVAPLFDAYRQFYDQSEDMETARRFIRDRLERRDSVILMAETAPMSDAPALGFVQLYPLYSSVSACPIWLLNDLYVAPAARGGGVGRALMEAAAEMARGTGAGRIDLATGRDNRAAKRLYESLGYELDAGFDTYHLSLARRNAGR